MKQAFKYRMHFFFDSLHCPGRAIPHAATFVLLDFAHQAQSLMHDLDPYLSFGCRDCIWLCHAETPVLVWRQQQSSWTCRPYSEHLVPSARTRSTQSVWGRGQCNPKILIEGFFTDCFSSWHRKSWATLSPSQERGSSVTKTLFWMYLYSFS